MVRGTDRSPWPRKAVVEEMQSWQQIGLTFPRSAYLISFGRSPHCLSLSCRLGPSVPNRSPSTVHCNSIHPSDLIPSHCPPYGRLDIFFFCNNCRVISSSITAIPQETGKSSRLDYGGGLCLSPCSGHPRRDHHLMTAVTSTRRVYTPSYRTHYPLPRYGPLTPSNRRSAPGHLLASSRTTRQIDR